MKKLIKEIINSKIEKREMFTSLDVTNDLKKTGVWATNREVSYEIKEFFKNKKTKYKTSVISVLKGDSGEVVDAVLYHHKKDDPEYYENREGHSISETDFIYMSNKFIKRYTKSLSNLFLND